MKFEKVEASVDGVDGVDGEVSGTVIFDKALNVNSKEKLTLSGFDTVIDQQAFEETGDIAEDHFLASSYEKVVNIFGRFQQESIALGLSELR